MLYYLIVLLIAISIFMAIYQASKIIFKIENREVANNLRKTKIKRSVVKNKKLSHCLAKYMKMPHYKKSKMEQEFRILGVEMTAEEYTSEYLFKGLVGLSITLMLIAMKLYIVAAIAAYVSLQIFVKEKNKLGNTFRNRRIRTEKEAPFFIRFFNVALKNNDGDLIGAFEQYSKVAKYLKPEIDKCLVDMKSPNTDGDSITVALENLDERLNTPIISDFITGLIKSSSGQDQSTYFEFLERDVLELSFLNLRRDSDVVQKKLRRKMYVLLFTFVGMVVAFFVLAVKVQFGL